MIVLLDLISVHVPKCGGMTIRSHLIDYYGADDVLLDYGGAPRSAVLESRYSSRTWCAPGMKRCIHGFFNARKYETVQARLMTTCLREPVKRLLSQYWYWMHLEGADNPMVEQVRRGEITLLDLARHPETTGLYTGLLFDGVDMMAFDIIGDTDDLGGYLTQLASCLGTTFERRMINESPGPSYRQRIAETMADQAVMSQIRDALRNEIKFYERHVGRGLVGRRAQTAGYCVREAHRADVMVHHPLASEVWPPRHRPPEQTGPEEEAEILLYGTHAGQAPAAERVERGELGERSVRSRDYAIGPEIDLVLADGLSPDARVIDIGAGTLRLAREFAPMLAPHHYFAVEPNARLVEWGRSTVIKGQGLEQFIPDSNLIIDAAFNFRWATHPFDVAIASFVFDRLPLAALEQCLAGLGPAMKPGGHFYLTYCPLPEDADYDDLVLYVDGDVSWPDRAPFHYRLADLAAAAQRHGWTLETSMPLSTAVRCHHEQARLRYGSGRAAPLAQPKSVAKPAASAIKNWWQSPEIWRHVNALLGDPGSARPSSGFHKLIAETAGKPLARGLSMVAGDGGRELRLMLTDAVERFDLWSSSEALMAAGKAEAQRFGLAERVTWHLGDGLKEATAWEYDLAYWNQTLHMQPDVDVALARSIECLRPSGVLAIDSYVGPSRFQYGDTALDAATRFRESLPGRLLRTADPASLPLRPARVPLEKMVALSPHLAPDSGRILDVVRSRLPGATIRLTGGCIYQLGLDGVLANIDIERDAWVLNEALLLDRVLCDLGHSHFAVIVGQPTVQ